LFGLRKLSLLEVGKAQRIGNVVIIGRERKRGFQFARRLFKLARHEISLAQHVVRGRALWIAGQSAA
jgi:hypothetical protein